MLEYSWKMCIRDSCRGKPVVGKIGEYLFLRSVSGRDENKIEKCGLTLAYSHDALYFEEAKLVFVCRKMCHVPLTPETFDDPALDASIYGDKDYHTLYIGEILEVWKQD